MGDLRCGGQCSGRLRSTKLVYDSLATSIYCPLTFCLSRSHLLEFFSFMFELRQGELGGALVNMYAKRGA